MPPLSTSPSKLDTTQCYDQYTNPSTPNMSSNSQINALSDDDMTEEDNEPEMDEMDAERSPTIQYYLSSVHMEAANVDYPFVPKDDSHPRHDETDPSISLDEKKVTDHLSNVTANDRSLLQRFYKSIVSRRDLINAQDVVLVHRNYIRSELLFAYFLVKYPHFAVARPSPNPAANPGLKPAAHEQWI
eukprot:TRINITY_DN10090_c0_g1_i1.p1 TRINITY_DN10090_c0_g1~~TRINITY_DN10090_c0_g1_i1.p1  ORF type:complete len:187 (-),score=43.03 TRINITY_DN10090_c0_g1_i1:9-569(-)